MRLPAQVAGGSEAAASQSQDRYYILYRGPPNGLLAYLHENRNRRSWFIAKLRQLTLEKEEALRGGDGDRDGFKVSK